MLTTAYARREIALIGLAGAAATAVVAWYFAYWALVPAAVALEIGRAHV